VTATGPDEAPPRVGIVIAAHDAARWVAETLRSVQAQTLEDFHCVVVDDGSRDDTADVARATTSGDPRFAVVQRPQGGVSAARNTGLAALPATCSSVAFLDSDDLWLPDALEVLVAALDARPDAVGVTATAELVDEDSRPVDPGLHPAKLRERLVAERGRLVRLPIAADTTFEVLATAGRIWPPAVVLLRRHDVDDVGGFDVELTVSEDWDLFLRLSRRGPLCFLDRQVAWYRRRRGSLTASDEGRVVYFNDVVRHKAWAAPENTPAQRRAAARGWRAVQLEATLLTGRNLARAVRRASRSQARLAARLGVPLAAGLLRGHPPLPRPADGMRRTPMIAVVQPDPRRRSASAASSAPR
jgi:glycosyltransferase involved in cell wall biosynthesis